MIKKNTNILLNVLENQLKLSEKKELMSKDSIAFNSIKWSVTFSKTFISKKIETRQKKYDSNVHFARNVHIHRDRV